MPGSSTAIRPSIRGQLAVVCLATAIVLLANLGGPPLWDEDEPKNAACSLGMLAAGDWVVPRYNNQLRSDKPPLVNWLQMAGYAAFGRGETGARIGSALLTIATSGIVAATACSLFPTLPLAGLWAGLAMGSCLWTGVAGRAATPDAGLCFFTTLALAIVARSRVRPSASGSARFSLGTAIACGVALGGAVLAKGPVGLALPLAAFLLFAWWQRFAATVGGCTGMSLGDRLARMGGPAVRSGWGAIHDVRAVVVALAAVAVAAPWYLLVWQRTGGQWVRDFLLVHNVQRFSAPMEGHGGPPFYYLVVLAVGLFPWSIVAGLTAVDAVRNLRQPTTAAAHRLLVSWLAVWLGCFTLAGTKLPGYVWPAYPAAALLTAAFLERWRLDPAAAPGRWMQVGWAILAAAGAAFAVGLPLAARALDCDELWLGVIGLVPLVAAGAAWRSQLRGDRGAALGWLAACGCLTVTFLTAVGADRVGGRIGPRSLVAAAASAPATWATYQCNVPGLVFYTHDGGRDAEVPRLDAATIGRFFDRHPDARVVVTADRLDELRAAAPAGHEVVARVRSLSRGRELVLLAPASIRAPVAGRDLERTLR